MTQKTYAITGVSNGIGHELALLLKQAGHTIIGLDLAKPQTSVDQFIEIDLSDKTAIEKAIAEINVPLDGLCNSAGLPPRDDLEAKILAVNFLGTKYFTNLIRPKLIANASVVNMASRAGHGWRDSIEQVKRLANLNFDDDLQTFITDENIDPIRAYDLTKEAIILWTMTSSETYLQQNMRINSISPGAVETGIFTDFENAFGDRMTRNVQRAGRAGQPQEVAHLAAFLLSAQSSWIKGTDISIDGGMSAFNTADALQLDQLL